MTQANIITVSFLANHTIFELDTEDGGEYGELLQWLVGIQRPGPGHGQCCGEAGAWRHTARSLCTLKTRDGVIVFSKVASFPVRLFL